MPPHDVYTNPTFPVQQRVQESGDRTTLNLRTFLEPTLREDSIVLNLSKKYSQECLS